MLLDEPILLATLGRAPRARLGEPVERIAFARGGAVVVAAGTSRAMAVLAGTGERSHGFEEGPRRTPHGRPAFASDAGLAFFLRDGGEVLETRRLDDGSRVREVTLPRPARALLACDPRGTRVAVSFDGPDPFAAAVSPVDGSIAQRLPGTSATPACALLADGTVVTAASGAVHVSRPGAPASHHPRTPHPGQAQAMATSADGRTTLVLWQTSDYRAQGTFERFDVRRPDEGVPLEDPGAPFAPDALAVSPGGDRIATCALDRQVWGNRVTVLDDRGTPLWSTGVVRGRSPSALAFSEDGRRLAIGCQEGDVWILDLAAPRGPALPPDEHPAALSSLAIVDDREVLAGTRAGTIHAWSLGNPAAPPQTLELAAGVLPSAVAPAGADRLAILDHATLQWLDERTGAVERSLDLACIPVLRGHHVAACDADGRVTLVGLTSRETRSVRLHDFARTAGDEWGLSALDDDGRTLACWTRTDTGGSAVLVWDLPGGTLVRSLPADDLLDVRRGGFSLGVRGGALQRYRIDGSMPPLPGPRAALAEAGARALSPDGASFALWTGERISVWTISEAQPGLSFPAGGTLPASTDGRGGMLRFSADGRLLAASGPDRRIRVWRIAR